MNYSSLGKISLLDFTYIAIIACLMGVNFFSINLGLFQLSPYRFLVLIALFFLPKVIRACNAQIKTGVNFYYVFFLIFWITYSFIPVLWVKDYVSWAKSLSFLITGTFSTLLIFGFLTDKVRIIKALEIVVVISVIYFGFAFFEMFTGTYFFVTEGNLEYYQEFSLLQSATGFREPVTVFGNPNDYSLFLFFTVVFSFLLYKVKQKLPIKFFYLGAVIVSVFLIICTQSRAGFIGVCLFFIIYLFFAFINKPMAFKLKAILTLLILYAVITPILREHLEFFRDVATIELNASTEGSSDDIRKNLIKNGLEFLKKTFLLGVGLGNIEYHMFHFPVFSTGDTTNIHNWWMEILVSSGIFVFGYYILVYLYSTYMLYRKNAYSKSSEMRFFYSVFLASSIAFVISSIGASSLMGSEWIWPLMAICMKAPSIVNDI